MLGPLGARRWVEECNAPTPDAQLWRPVRTGDSLGTPPPPWTPKGKGLAAADQGSQRGQGGDTRREEAAERRVVEAAERRAADRNPTRSATSFGDQLADLVDESRRNSVMQAGEGSLGWQQMLERRARAPPPEPLPPSALAAPPAAEEMRAGGVKVREERTRFKEARRRREAGLLS